MALRFTELNIKGAYLIETDEITDERGSFSRQFCVEEFAKVGINFSIKQCSLSTNYKKGVIRGMHFQKEPFSENKLVSCFKGACLDVLVDLREDSPTYMKWESFELSEENKKMLYIPENCAHGFQTLRDNTVIYYQIDAMYAPEAAAGVRYNDPKIGIEWCILGECIMNERDKNYNLL